MDSSFLVIKIKRDVIENCNSDDFLNEIIKSIKPVPTIEQIKIKDKFISYLLKNKKNQTPERYKVLEKICFQDDLFTINEIHEQVSNEMRVALKTVNNAFHLLEEAKIINKIIDSGCLFRTNYFEVIK